jgi:hypothetical protein
MRRCIFVLVTCALPLAKVPCQTVFSPGVRVTVVFGDTTDFSLGLEVSRIGKYTTDAPTLPIPIVLDIDRTLISKRWKLHLGAEWLFLEAGPSVIFDKDGTHYGLTFSPFLPVGPMQNAFRKDDRLSFYPGYAWTWWEGPTINELYLLVKWYKYDPNCWLCSGLM